MLIGKRAIGPAWIWWISKACNSVKWIWSSFNCEGSRRMSNVRSLKAKSRNFPCSTYVAGGSLINDKRHAKSIFAFWSRRTNRLIFFVTRSSRWANLHTSPTIVSLERSISIWSLNVCHLNSFAPDRNLEDKCLGLAHRSFLVAFEREQMVWPMNECNPALCEFGWDQHQPTIHHLTSEPCSPVHDGSKSDCTRSPLVSMHSTEELNEHIEMGSATTRDELPMQPAALGDAMDVPFINCRWLKLNWGILNGKEERKNLLNESSSNKQT